MTFTSILSAWAAYTRGANEEMTRILATLPAERLTEAAPTCYKNLAGLLDHGLRGSLFWLKRASKGGLDPDFLPAALEGFALSAPGSPCFSDLAGFTALRTRLDALFVGLCARGDDGAFSRLFSFPGKDHAPITMELGSALIAAMNHEVHHRGAVSTILDGWGVDNDWSGLVPYLSAPGTAPPPQQAPSPQ